MKIKDFIKELKEYNQEAEVLVSSDEELNNIYSDVQTSYFEDGEKRIVIWGNSGSEIE